MSEVTNQDVDTALDSLGQTAMRVKDERDSLLAAAKSLRQLIENTAQVFSAKQIEWLMRKPAFERLCDAIEKAEEV